MSKEEKIPLILKRSNRKTISIEITRQMQVIVRAPLRMSDQKIALFIKEKDAWIQKHFQQMKERKESVQNTGKPMLSQQEVNRLADEAMQIIPELAAQYAKQIGVTYGRITIRCQKTRWGSCSQKGNLNFNCLLMLAPREVLIYVVVHELCHRKQMNHSKLFWNEVRAILPDYEEQKQWLKAHGDELMARVGY